MRGEGDAKGRRPFLIYKERSEMRTHEFIRAMKNRLGCQEAEAIQDWLEFAGDIADGTETDYERELDDIMRALSYVRNNFSPDVLQKSVRFPTPGQRDHLRRRPVCLRHGGKAGGRAARDGRLEDGYVPATDDETGTLSLVRVEDPEEQVFLAVNEPETMVRRALERAEGFWLRVCRTPLRTPPPLAPCSAVIP